jgi:ABC-2 type transport system ATP-binding protein
MAMIKVKNLTKKYNGLKAVDNISFEVKQGETFGILGPNGAGKTTTLEILEGLRKPTYGTAFIDKLSIKKDREHIKEIIGVQLQSTAFLEYLTVKEILQLFADLYSNPIDVESLIRDVMLEPKKKSYATQLSGGQQQRLSIASALVNNPKVIFLDEPTTGLDPQARRSVWQLIRRIQKKGQTTVITTHYMEEAEKLCDRIAIMDRGKIIALDTPQGLIKSSGIASRIEFRVTKKIDIDIEKICGGKLLKKDHRVVIETKEAEKSLHRLVECAEEHNIEILDLSVKQPTLEDVFLKLTGKKLRE